MAVNNHGCCWVVPEDVIVEVLSWLPVKSLLRFRSVCKSWLSIIKNQSFVAKHLQHYYHHSSSTNQNVRLLLTSLSGRNFDLRLFSDPTLADTTTFDDLGFTSPRPLSFYGPCNGIICVCNGIDRLALWNPATRDFRPLPKFHPPNFPLQWNCNNMHNVAFGLDLTTAGGDFKAVWIRKFSSHNLHVPPTYATHVAIYTFSTDSWREFDQGNYSFSDLYLLHGSNCYTYLNGTYYWWAVREDKPDMVLAFDMSTDMFRDIPGPDGLPNSSSGVLDIFQGSLTRLHVDGTHPITSIDFWVMMQDQEDEGCCCYYWIKKLSIQSVSGVDMLGGRGIWNNGHLFVLTRYESEGLLHRLGLYDLDTGEIKDMGLPELHWFDALMYKDSLITVKGSNHNIRVPDFFEEYYPPRIRYDSDGEGYLVSDEDDHTSDDNDDVAPDDDNNR